MKIALDFDETYTLDPSFWDEFIDRAKQKSFDIRIVTYRYERMEDPALTKLKNKIPVIYTSYQRKRPFCEKLGFFPDVWIDDFPEIIVKEH